jgi:methyl-accepting chemotaxis protein
MQRGDFGIRMDGDYLGSFDEVKQAVNKTGETTLSYISEISDILGAISNGDLTVSVKHEYIGSYAPIKQALNTILGSLNKTMAEIDDAADQVLHGATQISESSMHLAVGSSKQASSIQQLSASFELINQKAKQSVENALNANEISQKSTVHAQDGNKAMTSMISSMDSIKESSDSISKIIKVIEDISFQTNLLALNAAVEAARAGEHGKGFTVVSDEVRSLASKSQQSAQDTTDLIENSNQRVKDGIEVANAAAASLKTIVGDVQQVSEIIAQIAEISKDQTDSISHVNIGVTDISHVVQDNSATSEECASASEVLNSQAEVLKQLVSFFKFKKS